MTKVFLGFPDLAHVTPNVQNWLWLRTDGVGKYYKNTMKFDGWRFDYVKGFGPWVKTGILMWVAFQLANTGTQT
jgi:hypothetical protein